MEPDFDPTKYRKPMPVTLDAEELAYRRRIEFERGDALDGVMPVLETASGRIARGAAVASLFPARAQGADR